ncbi:coiled-coil domain-containing protein 137 [Pelodiscus sinensis]|uniref:coiled-coil domain-containing protein 137 n=1 Tax=Pelodiscus sinensis TaxID=13735 RepID=UPI003F6B4A58
MGKRPPPPASRRAVRGEPRKGSQEKKKTNSKPKHLHEQEIPYRLRELMKSREEMKNPKSRKRRKAATGSKEKPAAPGDIPVPTFKRRKREGEQAYIRRMEQETQRVLFLTQNQLQREPEKEEPVPEKSQKKKEFQNKRLAKMRRKKEEKKVAMLEKALFQDPVQFGEVAMQPPALTVKPRKGVAKEKAGPRQLLLTPLLAPGRSAPARKAAPVSLARQRIVEEERQRVIQAYRDRKKRAQQRAPRSHLPGDELPSPGGGGELM